MFVFFFFSGILKILLFVCASNNFFFDVGSLKKKWQAFVIQTVSESESNVSKIYKCNAYYVFLIGWVEWVLAFKGFQL